MQAFSDYIPLPVFVEQEQEAAVWRDHFLKTAKIVGSLGIDSETSGIIKHKDQVVIWSLSDGANRIALPAKFIPMFREPLLENPEIDFDLTNAKFDAHMFANSGADLSKAGKWRCTLPQSFLVDENRQGRHGLKECTKEFLGRDPPTFEMVFGKLPPARKGVKRTQADLINEALADPVRRLHAIEYATLDAYDTFVLRRHLSGLLRQTEMFDGYTLNDFYEDVEAPFTKVLWRMERRGFQIDAGYLYELKVPMEQKMASIEKEFAKRAGQVVNLKSHAHVRWFFCELLGKQPVKMTSGGTKGTPLPSIDEEVLEQWAGEGDPYAKLMLDHRKLAKIHGTYVTSIMELLDAHYRLHTTLNQIGAQSGRLSSSEPNCQNIPAPAEDEFKIRDAFIAGFKKRLIVADYEQLEMRLMAHWSGDPKMIDAITKGIDLHCFSVSEMHGIPYDEVVAAKKAEKLVKEGKRPEQPELTPREIELLQMRQDAKACGFGIIYGIGGPRLAAQLTRSSGRYYSEQEGWTLIKKWLDVFPGVRDYIEDKKKEMRATGCVRTLVGRFRHCGDLSTMSKGEASAQERTLVNATIQGSAADVAKAVMLKIDSDQLLRSLGAEMLLQVHDELVFEVPDEDEVASQCKARIKELMEHPFDQPLRVPLPVSIGSGYSWASAK